MMTLKDSFLMNFPQIADERGDLSVIEGNNFPFSIKRVFYLYNLPEGAIRGGHALKMTEEVVVPLSGSFEVVLDDGFDKKSFFLNQPHYGLYIPPTVWRELKNFSPNAIVLVLTSTSFSQDDYIWDYNFFKKMAKVGKFK